jgi:hypothetical protein
MFLDEGKPGHENQSDHDKSGYDVLHHGSHSVVVGDRTAKDDTMGAAVNAEMGPDFLIHSTAEQSGVPWG